MRWYLEDVEQAIVRAKKKIDPVVDGCIDDVCLGLFRNCLG